MIGSATACLLRGGLLRREAKIHVVDDVVRRFGKNVSLGISVSAHAHTHRSVLSR